MQDLEKNKYFKVTFDKLFNILSTWKILVIFDKLVLYKNNKKNHFLKKDDALFQFFFKKKNYQLNLKEKNDIIKGINNDRYLRRSILFNKTAPIDKKVINENKNLIKNKQKILNLVVILENKFLLNKKKKIEDSFDKIENYFRFKNQYRIISVFFKEIISYIILQKKKIVFKKMKNNQKNKKNQINAFEQLKEFSEKRKINLKKKSWELIRKFLGVRKILKNVYNPFPFNVKKLSIKILSDYDNQPNSLYSLTSKNLNYVKFLSLMKYVDYIKDKKQNEFIKSFFYFFYNDMQKEKKLKKNFLNLIKKIKYLQKKKKREGFNKILQLRESETKKKYFLNFLKFFFIKKTQNNYRAFLNKIQKKKKNILSKMETGIIIKREAKIKKNGMKMLLFVLDHIIKKKLKEIFYKILQKKKLLKKKEKIIYGKIQYLKRPKYYKLGNNLSVNASRRMEDHNITQSIYKNSMYPKSTNNSFYGKDMASDKKLLVLLPTNRGHFVQKILTNPVFESSKKYKKKKLSRSVLTPKVLTPRTLKNLDLYDKNPKKIYIKKKKIKNRKIPPKRKVNLLPINNSKKKFLLPLKTIDVRTEKLSLKSNNRSFNSKNRKIIFSSTRDNAIN